MHALHTLGWNDFQRLCLTITREILGQTVESFLDSHDGGRDGAFTGTWKQIGFESLSGNFVIQCKFTSKPNSTIRPADLSDEAEKARKLVEKGLCDSYVLMTNAGLSGTADEKIKAIFKKAGVKRIALFGSSWISQQILENKRLRMLVPRLYGLGDLSQILDERAYTQARAILESMREDLAKVVVTATYRKAVDAINEHGFVLLIGEPAAGKSTIASLLAMAALDQWNASTLKLDEPSKVTEHWNPDEPSQFFWLDDAFGVTQYEEPLVRKWNHILPQIRPMLRKGAKMVMTSRDYIYNRARNDLKESAFPLLKESQVVIDVHDLTPPDKCQILYNHLRLGRQPKSFRTKIKPFLEDIASHPRFIPETARRLGDPLFTKGLLINGYSLSQFVERRERILQEILQCLDADSKAALALVFMRKGNLGCPVQLRDSEKEALERLGSDLGGCISALEALKGSFVLLSHASGEYAWQFRHPTIGDAYAAALLQSPEHLGIYIEGSAPERLLNQVTCGDAGIEKAVVLPPSLFPSMLEKLSELSRSKRFKTDWLSHYDAKRALQGFLSSRCSNEFLVLYLQVNPGLVNEVADPGLMLDTVPEVRLAKRLHDAGLLPEERRKQFVETVSSYAVDGQDPAAFSDEDIRSMFTKDELDELERRAREELLPRLADIRRGVWESNHDSDQDPEEYIQPFLDLLDSLNRLCGSDNAATMLVETEERHVRLWIDESTTDEPVRAQRELGNVETQEKPQSARSVFDDIDADDSDEAQ
jgi:energy-coupling factor transporter ATP-binding protein EcfA2